MNDSPPVAHVLLDVRDESFNALEDVSYLEMVGFRVTDRCQLPIGHHAVVSLQPDVVVLEFSSPPADWNAVREIRRTRRLADVGIVVMTPDRDQRRHQAAHSAGADVCLPITCPGLEWTARGVCAALASHGRATDVPGFARRARLGAGLCEGNSTREARILLFDAPDLPLLWRLLRAGYAVTPTTVSSARAAIRGTERPGLIVLDVDARSDALSFVLDNLTACPPLLCVSESPSAALAQVAVKSQGVIRIVSRTVHDAQLIAVVERLAPDGDQAPDPPGPEAVSRRAPLPYGSWNR
jgi:CheY-like chemotaxis protein